MVSNLTLPFARFSGEYAIKYMACAFHPSSSAIDAGKAELYMETDTIRRCHLQARLEQCGARHVVIHSFPRSDAEQLAGKFLGRVLRLGQCVAGARLYVRGSTEVVVPSPLADDDDEGGFIEPCHHVISN